MAGLKDIKKRVKTVSSTQKLTSAMKLLAASKLKHLTKELAIARTYTQSLSAAMHRAFAGTTAETLDAFREQSGSFFWDPVPNKPHILLVIGANKGLCGNYDLSVVRAALAKAHELGLDKCRFIPATVKAGEYFQKNQPHATEALAGLGHFDPHSKPIEVARYIFEHLKHRFEHEEIGSVSMVRGRFVNALIQKVEYTPLFPIVPELGVVASVAEPGAPEIEPAPVDVFVSWLEHEAILRLYLALLESDTCEQAARVTMMENAKRNAEELIDSLTLQYNRTRQANITNELIEIVAGRSAMVAED